MKYFLLLFSLCILLSGCATTSTGKGLLAYDDNRSLDAIPLLEKGILEGDKVAPMVLAMIYLSDAQVPMDVEKSLHYFSEVKEMEGNIYDQYVDYYIDFIHASILLNDDALDNDIEGAKLLRQSKYLNFSPALMLLAKSYSEGVGVSINYKLSHKLFLRAVEYGNSEFTKMNYAWVLATHKDAKFREVSDVMTFIPELDDVDENYRFIYFDLLAVVYARNGNFENAIKYQKKSIELINKEIPLYPNYKTWLDEYNNQLALFEANKPYTNLD